MFINQEDIFAKIRINNLISEVKNENVKDSLVWSINELLSVKENIIIYAPNASGKTTLSNIISGEIPHFHTKFVEYIDDHAIPHIRLNNKAKKFSYKDFNSYDNILKQNKELDSIAKFAADSLWWYKGSAPLCSVNFFKSINTKIINEAKNNINLDLFGGIPKEEYYNLDYDLKPYVYFSRGISDSYSRNIKDKIKKIKEMPNIKWIDDENESNSYIRNLLNSSTNPIVKNFIYALILLISKYEDDIKNLTSLGLGLLLRNTNTSFDISNVNQKSLEEIAIQLRQSKIIDDTTFIKLKRKKIIFEKSKKNITRNIFQTISDGQSNLMSYIFFLEITLIKENRIILDDPFDTLDNGNSYRVLSTIKKYENKKNFIVLTHTVSSMEMMKQYLKKEWYVQYLKNKISFKMSDLDNLERKLFYLYKNNFSDENAENDGFLLILRYLRDDSKLNALIYHTVSNKDFKIKFLEKYYFANKPEIPTNLNFYVLLLDCYGKLLNIKKYMKNKYSNLAKIKEQIKSRNLETEDVILKKYRELFFIINDLSHNNSWGFHLLDIFSFREELLDLHSEIEQAAKYLHPS